MRNLTIFILLALGANAFAAGGSTVPTAWTWRQSLADRVKRLRGQERDFHELSVAELTEFYPLKIRRYLELLSSQRQLWSLDDEEAEEILNFITDPAWTKYDLNQLGRYLHEKVGGHWVEPYVAIKVGAEFLFYHELSARPRLALREGPGDHHQAL